MIIVLMGVSGSGKTTVGELLAGELGWPFYDADDFHPPANVEKMSRSLPLSDSDRIPWLERLRELVRDTLGSGSSAVLACSALKAAYREYLLIDERVRLIYLHGSPELIRQRITARRGHFMKPTLLDSQLATLEEPGEAIYVDIAPAPAEIVRNIRDRLGI